MDNTTTTTTTYEGLPVTQIHLTPKQQANAEVYFSLILGLALGYIFIKGLLSNWKS